MMRPSPGQPFGPYAVEHPVGQGGFGAVYRARDTRLGRLVALKVLLPSEVSDPESVARFLREARLAAALEHPNIVRILEIGSIDETPYIAMEWIEGATLKRARVDRPTELLATIAETLAFAHEHGIVHRDLKPANVMIDRDGRPKLVDFGIAKRLTGSTMATREGIVLGTPQYMAPEQELTSAVDARADQWAWGAIAYELLTGERPTKPALAHAALDARHGAVVLRALAIAPSERFASMRELLAAWHAASAPAVVVPAPPTTARAAPASRSRWLLFAGTTAGVAALGLVLLFVLSQRSPPPAQANVPVVTSSVATPSAPIASVVTPPEETTPDDTPDATPSASASAPRAPTHPARIAKGARAFSWGHHGFKIDWEDMDAQLLAIASRCFKGQPAPRGTQVNVEIAFTAAGDVTRVRTNASDVTAPAIAPCIENASRKLKFPPTAGNGTIEAGFVADLR